MITVTLYRDGEDLTACRILGHGDWADHGKDIVCAAVSILGCTCVNALESVCGVIPEDVESAEGLLSFRLPAVSPEQNAKAQILMGALQQGMKDLAEQYPQNVTLSIKERRL